MKKYLTIALFFFSAEAFALTVDHWQTSRGVDVYFVANNDLPMLDVRLVFDAASSRDGEKAGLAKLTNALIGMTSQNYNEQAMIDLFDDFGAILSTNSLTDTAMIGLRTLSQKDILEPVMRAFTEVITTANFPDEKITRLKKQFLGHFQQRLQSPQMMASRAFMQTLFEGHPYSSDPFGSPESLEKITRSDIIHFYQHYYVANNLNIIIIGDVDKNKAKRIAEDLSTAFPVGEKPKPLAKIKEKQQTISKKIDFHGTQNHLLVGHLGVRRDDKDYYPLYVGNHILGGSGLNSILSTAVRENEGLSYSVYSYFVPMAAGGYFLLGLQTAHAQVAQAQTIVKKVLDDFINQRVTAEQLQDAKDNLVGGFALRTASNQQLLSYLSVIALYQLPLDYLTRFTDDIEKVSIEDIYQAFQKLFGKQPHWLEINVGQ